MLNFFVKCLLVASWVVALALSALTVEERSSWNPLTSDAVIDVTEWNKGQSVTDLRRDLSALADAEEVLIGQMEPAVQDNRGERVIYLVGPGVDEVIAHPPRIDFGGAMRTNFAAMTEIDYQDPVGHWVVLGDQDVVPVLAEALRVRGATVEVNRNRRWPELAVPGDTVIVVGLMLTSATAAFVISRTRRAAITRLHGGSMLGFALKEVGPLGVIWAVAGVALLAAGGGWLLATQGGIGLIEWVAHAGHSGIIFLGFAVLGALPTLAVVWNVELVRALKGELPARGIVVASWAMRAGAVVLALGAVSQCLMLATAASHRERSLAAMQTVPGAHLLFIGGAVHSNEAQNEMAKVVNPWVVKHAKEGRVLLADLQDGPGGALLYVNQRYLDAHPLLLADGSDVRDLMVPGQVVALIPSHRWEEREVLLPELQLDVDFRAGGGEAVSLAVFQVESGNQLPLFGIPSETEALGEAGTFENRQGTWVEDPIVLVTRDDEYHSYLSAASQGRAFFFDADQLVHEIKADPVLAGYVTSLTPVETRAAHHAVEALVRFRLALVKAGIAGVIALVAGLSLAVSHSKLRGQRIFVRHLHGGSAIGSYRMLLLAETVLVLGALVWLPWQVMQQRAEFDALAEATGGGLGLGPPPELQLGDLVPGMLVVLVVSGGMAVTLWQIHRRIIRKGISEA